MKKTKIAWTNATFNPWWGCEKVSPGCANCYAETFAKRTGNNVWGHDAPRRFFKDAHWNEPLGWNAEAAKSDKPFRVFCSSMADVCEDRSDLDASRKRLQLLIEATPALTWLLLTKRPENFVSMFWPGKNWPDNVWALTTVENQEMLSARAPYLYRLPCVVRGISYEPAIGPLDIGFALAYIDWIICGGESGPRARPMQEQWARNLLAQCRSEGTAFFMKQLGGHPNKRDHLTDFPDDLRVRDWPIVRAALKAKEAK